MSKLFIKNWSDHQHYKDRKPPWIKLKTDVFGGYDFSRLQDASKLLLICIWTLASREDDGSVPHDFLWIKSYGHLKDVTEKNLKELIDKGFLICSELLADCLQDAPRSVSVSPSVSDSERGGVGEKIKPEEYEIKLPDCVKAEVWSDFVQHRKEIKKPLTKKAAEGSVLKLEQWFHQGHDPTEIMRESIRNGWQGLFEPKNRGNQNGNNTAGQNTPHFGMPTSVNGAIGSRSVHQGSLAASEYRDQVLADKVREREARRNAEVASKLGTV